MRALSVAAGAAIENARLYDQTRRRQRWLEAAGEITGVLLGEINRADALRLVAERACEVAESDLTLVLITTSDTELVVEVAAGNAPDKLTGTVVGAASGELGDVVRDRYIVTVDVAALAGVLTLRVVDEGIGIPAAVRSVGGLRNMQRRAEEYGGTCVVDAVEPHGTGVTWTAPLEDGPNIPD